MSNPWKKQSVFDQNIYSFLRNDVNKWVACQYCGRTLQLSQLMAHWRKFHDYDSKLIIDFN